MNWKNTIWVLLTAIMLSACVSVTKVQSTGAKAYVVDGHIFGTDMLNCDASDGTPECWPVVEKEGKGGE